MNTRKVKRHRNCDTKAGNREPQQNYRLGTVTIELLEGGLNKFYRPNLTLSFWSGTKYLVGCSVHMKTF